MPEIDSRVEELAMVVRSDAELKALRDHLDEVINGEAFRGSRRSAQFLQHIVEKAIAQETEALKERTIGIELFGRRVDYDTGVDAIVRVTASEVRRRLLQHYGRSGDASDFRISLPPGGYSPDIHRNESFAADAKRAKEMKWVVVPALKETLTPSADTEQNGTESVSTPGFRQRIKSLPLWKISVITILFVALAFGAGFTLHAPVGKRVAEYPWPFLISASAPLQIITSDPNIAEIRGLTNRNISVSDYANRKYGCEVLTNDLRYVCQTILQGDKAAAVDAEAVAKIAALTERYGGKFAVHVARSLRVSDFQTDSSYVLLGSSRSNPWIDLFSDQMGFRIEYDPTSQQDVVLNLKPRKGELPVYKPTAKGLGTGQSYALIGFLHNIDQQGQVLSLAGASAEGTLAAANMVESEQALSLLRKACGISGSSLVHFEALIRVNTLAGASTQPEVIACHILPDFATH